MSSPSGPLTTGHRRDLLEVFLFGYPLSLFYREYLVDSGSCNLIQSPAWPADFDQVYFGSFLQAEMQSQIALGNIAAAAAYFVNLDQIAGDHFHLRSNSVAIAFYSYGFYEDRVVCITAVVAEELRKPVEIVDHHQG